MLWFWNTKLQALFVHLYYLFLYTAKKYNMSLQINFTTIQMSGKKKQIQLVILVIISKIKGIWLPFQSRLLTGETTSHR